MYVPDCRFDAELNAARDETSQERIAKEQQSREKATMKSDMDMLQQEMNVSCALSERSVNMYVHTHTHTHATLTEKYQWVENFLHTCSKLSERTVTSSSSSSSSSIFDSNSLLTRFSEEI